jgi:hypothetical protein
MFNRPAIAQRPSRYAGSRKSPAKFAWQSTRVAAAQSLISRDLRANCRFMTITVRNVNRKHMTRSRWAVEGVVR